MKASELPLWTEIHIQRTDIDIPASQVFWIKHPQLKITVIDNDLETAIKEFVTICQQELKEKL